MYCIAILFGSAALAIPYVSPAVAYALSGFLLFASLVAVYFLENAPYEHQAKLQKSSSPS
jgi:hypothetical protein